MVILGYLFAVLIGLTLGLIGGGGSILTVPVLVYLLKLSPVTSTAYSLFVVGSTSLAGAISYLKKKQLCYRAAIALAVPSFIAVFLTRRFLVPLVPETILEFSGISLHKDVLIMLAFALLMILSSFSMIRKNIGSVITEEEFDPESIKINDPMIIAEGLILGILTGFVGAGGGFLIIPALVLLVGLPMKVSIGTSLLIIATNSLIGFTGDLYAGLDADWAFLLGFSALALAGIFIGTYLSKKIHGDTLKPVFGYFTLVLGLLIIIKEVLFHSY
jgi:uncharacterized membrane protein YfcA